MSNFKKTNHNESPNPEYVYFEAVTFHMGILPPTITNVRTYHPDNKFWRDYKHGSIIWDIDVCSFKTAVTYQMHFDTTAEDVFTAVLSGYISTDMADEIIKDYIPFEELT